MPVGKERLLAGIPGGECDASCRATQTGEPPDSGELVLGLERAGGKEIARSDARPSAKGAAKIGQAGVTACLFAGGVNESRTTMMSRFPHRFPAFPATGPF